MLRQSAHDLHANRSTREPIVDLVWVIDVGAKDDGPSGAARDDHLSDLERPFCETASDHDAVLRLVEAVDNSLRATERPIPLVEEIVERCGLRHNRMSAEVIQQLRAIDDPVNRL